MKRVLKGIFGMSMIVLFANNAMATQKIISCPILNLSHYGKNFYHDRTTGKNWSLIWSRKLENKKLVWDSISIPVANTCGTGKSSAGLPITYRCVVLQCKSGAVTAALGQHHSLKCFSAYLSTQKTFYCEDFSLS